MEEQLKKLQVCVYIIIALLVVNTIALFASLKDTDKVESSEGTGETYDYDASMFTEINADEYMDALNDEEAKVVYLGRSTCGFCIQFLPTLQQAQKDYGYTTLYVDTDKITNDDLTKIIGTMGIDITEFGTPTTAIVKNGKVIAKQIGYTDYATFTSLLEENGFTK